MSPVLDIQRRLMELGRIRLGAKTTNGAPKKLDKFRLTSASRSLLEVAADVYGGTVREWAGAPDEGYFELYTERDILDIILPPVFDSSGDPTVPYSQWYELWSGGGCDRRCDGQVETLSGKPCMCNPDERACKITTRVQVILPDLPGLGVWRLESHGWNAAALLPGTLELLGRAAHANQFIPGVLRLEQRSSKLAGLTRRFVVPVIDTPTLNVAALVSGTPLAVNAPTVAPARPALEAANVAPVVEAETPVEWGPAPEILPARDEPPVEDVAKASPAQLKKLNVLIGTLRDAGTITTAQVYEILHREKVLSEDGQLHWAPLRDSLSKVEASVLIEWASGEPGAAVTAVGPGSPDDLLAEFLELAPPDAREAASEWARGKMAEIETDALRVAWLRRQIDGKRKAAVA